jgi:methyl-accepting chemotaxis protein
MMLSRISVNMLLKSVIATLAMAVVVMLSMGAWTSWNRLTAISRIASVSEASGHLFKALHNLRTDRATTTRDLNAEQALPSMTQQLVEIRSINLPALKAGLAALAKTDFPQKQEALSGLGQAVSKLEALHQETATAFRQPKAARRAGLSQEFFKTTTDLMALIDKISTQMVQSVKLDDAYVDQLLTIKQLAWIARNTGGDASVMISNALGGLPLPPDAMFQYHANVGKVETAWAAIEDVASGLPLPAAFWAAVEKGRAEYFGREYVELRTKLLKSLVAGEKVEMKAQDWSRLTVSKLAALLGVAEAALDVAKDHAEKQRGIAQRTLWIELGSLILALLLASTVMVLVSRRVIAPLRTIQEAMAKVATGNFNVQLQHLERKDEVGQIAGAVTSMVGRVREIIAEIKSSAREVTNASAEISTSTTDLSQRTEEQAASLEETSASMEEISATVKKNAENAQQANVSAAQTQQVADRGGEVVAKAVGAMAKIEDSSRKISDIIGVIDEIARQTNLLALNAAVEAARAGEAGRGFAVVASEVRSLAQRSSQAAKDIKDLITNSNSQVKDGVDLVNQAGTALNEIVESIKSVASIVADIANASSEQATGLEQINKALTQMDEVTQQNSALVEENAATAKTLETQAKAMDEQVAFFQIDVAETADSPAHRAPKRKAGRQNLDDNTEKAAAA